MPGEFVARQGLISRGNVVVTGSLTTSGSLTATGTITATTLVVQTVTSSISSITGSTNFGSLSSNTHTFTGSLNVTGALAVVTNGIELQVNPTGVNLGNALTDSHVISGSLRVNPNGLFVSGSGVVGIGTSTVVEGTQGSGTISIIPNSSVSNGPLIQFAGNGRIRPASNGDRLSIDGNALFLNSFIGGNIVTNTAGGNFGIGTSSVTDFGSSYTVLDVYNGTVGGYLLARSPNVTGQISVDNNTAMYVQTRTNHPILFAPNNSEKMRITTAGNVGIGTNNPSHELSVVDSSFNQYSLRLESASGNTLNRWGGIGLAGEASNTKAAILFVSEGGSFSRGNLVFANNSDFNQNSATPSDARMIITKEGYVTTPSQPFASVGLTTDFSSVGNIIVWQQAHYNVGSRYNTSTGIFTCPVAGTYLVSIMCMTAGIDQTLDIELRVNGATSNVLVPYQSTNGGIYNQVSGMAMLALQANDTLAFRLNSGSVYGTSAGRHGSVVFALVG